MQSILRQMPRPSLFLILVAIGVGCSDRPTAPGDAPPSMAVSPAVDTLPHIGDTVRLTVTVNGQQAGPPEWISWTTLNGGVATVDSVGVVRGVAAGTALVVARWGELGDTVVVVVAPPTLTQLILRPASITLAPGASTQFTVAGTWSDGSATAPAATYSATGGTISPSGLYTAGATPGAFRVIATQQGETGAVADTTTVTIAVSPLQGVRYVSTGGNDSNPGTQAAPLRTIQKCLDTVQAGDTCMIAAGTYSESLTLRVSGTASLPITLRCETPRVCTVNSGNAQTLGTSNRVHYWVIDGLRFIGAAVTSQATLDFGQGTVWSATDETAGNNGFVLKNCYVEGNMKFYGHNNLVDNCEFNGKGIWTDGIRDGYATSHDNTYRNNVVYSYRFRGIWSMNATDHILIEGNTIHDVVYGIDCDGAAVPVTDCRVINNLVYNTGTTEWGAGIFLENCFNCLIQANTIHDVRTGTGIFVINYGNGSSTGWHTFNNIEYRDDDSRTRILNNVIYNYPTTGSGVYVSSVSGLTFDHNTFHSLSNSPAIGFHAEPDGAGVLYVPANETITNNIFSSGGVTWYGGIVTTGLVSSGNFSGDPSFVNPPVDFHLRAGSPACGAGAFPC